MIEICLRKIVDSLAYIILFSFPLYYALRDYYPISHKTFALIVTLTFALFIFIGVTILGFVIHGFKYLKIFFLKLICRHIYLLYKFPAR